MGTWRGITGYQRIAGSGGDPGNYGGQPSTRRRSPHPLQRQTVGGKHPGGHQSFFTLPRLIGRDNTLYQGMIEGINRRMNLDWDENLSGREERWCVELFAAEVIIQEIGHGKWVDLAEVDRLFALEKWRNNIHRYAHAAGIR